MIFATVLSDNYLPLFKALLNSLLTHNSKFNYEYKIICDDTLNIYNRKLLKNLYKNISFIEIDYSKYKNKQNIRFKSIEAFNIKADKVIFLDADMLCRGDISFLRNLNTNIAMVRETHRACWNAGLIVIGKKYLNNETYLKLLNHDIAHIEGYGTDQKIYNDFFNDIFTLPKEWNTFITDRLKVKNPIFLHYIYKPHIPIGMKRITKEDINLWRKYYES